MQKRGKKVQKVQIWTSIKWKCKFFCKEWKDSFKERIIGTNRREEKSSTKPLLNKLYYWWQLLIEERYPREENIKVKEKISKKAETIKINTKFTKE